MVTEEYMLFLFKRLLCDNQEITSMLCCNGVLLSLVCQFLMRERLVQFAAGIENIRDTIPFSQTPGSAEFLW